MPKRSLTTARGQERVTYQYLRLFRHKVDRRLRTLRGAVNRLGEKVHDVEVTLDPLIDHVASMERELHDLQQRVALERRRRR